MILAACRHDSSTDVRRLLAPLESFTIATYNNLARRWGARRAGTAARIRGSPLLRAAGDAIPCKQVRKWLAPGRNDAIHQVCTHQTVDDNGTGVLRYRLSVFHVR